MSRVCLWHFQCGSGDAVPWQNSRYHYYDIRTECHQPHQVSHMTPLPHPLSITAQADLIAAVYLDKFLLLFEANERIYAVEVVFSCFIYTNAYCMMIEWKRKSHVRENTSAMNDFCIRVFMQSSWDCYGYQYLTLLKKRWSISSCYDV